MKVIHFSTTDYGGAYRASERISACMKSVGIDSKVVVRTKVRQDTDCEAYFKTRTGRLISKAKNLLNLILSSGDLVTDMFGTDVSRSAYVKEADVIVLHWVNSFISYRGIKQLVKTGKRIIWVMHDEWIYTEGYHYTCERSQNPGVYKRLLAGMNLKLKKAAFGGKGITFVAVSNWLRDQALGSEILKDEKVITIHNPLDTDKFIPGEYDSCKYDTKDRKVILFGADKATSNRTKGFSYLTDAVSCLDGNEYIAICFGNAPENTRVKPDNIEIIYTGAVNDDNELIRLYNTADVMVTPSVQEAFGYTCLEALACGTPVTGFNTSGLRDQIIHKENGYLAETGNSEDLRRGIEYCINNRKLLSKKARETAVKLSSYPVAGNRYADLLDGYGKSI